ncbi:DUF72 domain-containing protein [Bacillus sp. B1-b2]|uniref:DUF72 domain-containing protein n=1 Tax=Bacillus sp. B1-b2 TaxID=2653201 RepID=UPI0012618950|nr:DUF72 domain-containing protein [Bacillus sp. B1-b2]KAB7666496.1 DUF72 domain-containing protein [Bacillus sp. B1-b2]
MIRIGLTGWGDHDSLYVKNTSPPNKLIDYAGYFPVVEVDASFYAIQPQRNAENWVKKTPDSFQFIVKAYQGMTGHNRGDIPFSSIDEMFGAFIDSLEPYRKANKLAMVLFQFPPWFDCKKENVQYLRACKKKMKDIPCALEFRHQSWFDEKFRENTLNFMQEENWIHSICDEPQVMPGSVPTVLEPIGNQVLIRLHGRNYYGWQQSNNPKWREVRYLYRYNTVELEEWADNIHNLQKKCPQVYVLFNNNSGGDAADNAKHLLNMLHIEYDDLAPRQLDLF